MEGGKPRRNRTTDNQSHYGLLEQLSKENLGTEKRSGLVKQ